MLFSHLASFETRWTGGPSIDSPFYPPPPATCGTLAPVAPVASGRVKVSEGSFFRPMTLPDPPRHSWRLFPPGA